MCALLCLLLLTQVGADDMCRSGQVTELGECCDFCPAGHGVARACGVSNTECEACSEGVSFSPSEGMSPCRPCTRCPEQESMPCTAQADTGCHCREGAYLLPGTGCVQCSSCPPGYGVTAQCQAGTDTQCQRCPNDTFSERESREQACVPCWHCDDQSFVLRDCSTVSNTVCLPKNSMLPRRPGGSELPMVGGHVRSNGTGSGNGTDVDYSHQNERNIIVYCSILAAIVVGLLVYVGFKCWRTCKQKQQLSKSRGELGPSPETEKLQNDGGDPPLETGNPREQLSKSVSVELYRDRPLAQRQAVEAALGVAGGWRSLAAVLGYDEERVAMFGRGEDPVHTLLTDWASRNTSTVQALNKALLTINRGDVAEGLRGDSNPPTAI
eukprot:gi/632990361/ref/XP_007884133.1/ PREDICTED: tumor necrosis factor receptor superfamily member 16-like [Callorhinchus milii]